MADLQNKFKLGSKMGNEEMLFENTNSREWLTIREAAIYLGISANALRIRVHRGQIRAYKLGSRALRFKLRDLIRAFSYRGG